MGGHALNTGARSASVSGRGRASGSAGSSLRSVCVFCGSSPGAREAYVEAAAGLGKLLAQRGLTVVYGGAHIGTMGAVADAALAAGGDVVGAIPHSMVDRELAHGGLTELHVVDSMHERKAVMSQLADAYVALPGGAGTLDEFFEVWTWAQIGLHAKPIGLLDVDGFYQPLWQMITHMVEQGFVKQRHQEWLLIDSDAERLLDAMAERPAPDDKWS